MKPICTGCNKHPDQIEEYVEIAADEGMTPDAPPTEEEFTALHRRLSGALDRLSRIGAAVGGRGAYNPYTDEARHDDLERKVVQALELVRHIRAVT